MTEIVIWYDYDEVGDEWIVVSYVCWDGDVGREQSHLAVRTGGNIASGALCEYYFVDYDEEAGVEVHTACGVSEGDHPYLFNVYDESFHQFTASTEVSDDQTA